MAGDAGEVPGFSVPVHRALIEPILLGGAPRAFAIFNGTLGGAVELGLRLWLVGLGLWAIAGQLRVGLVHVNDQTVNDDGFMPMGGQGDSSNGSRHGGPANMEEFT